MGVENTEKKSYTDRTLLEIRQMFIALCVGAQHPHILIVTKCAVPAWAEVILTFSHSNELMLSIALALGNA